ncbi:hypothetical protein HPB50_018548 [Hyalomma asiaticum]|uniref:Uncharacterized protein n=1 Tax=Hyalomma asiaticum TaxID=266040 RepID=A0ACB7TKA4_HYAAI|nr:hypothetical protein HPB50_018548 [Hyalomma asiaticum]
MRMDAGAGITPPPPFLTIPGTPAVPWTSLVPDFFKTTSWHPVPTNYHRPAVELSSFIASAQKDNAFSTHSPQRPPSRGGQTMQPKYTTQPSRPWRITSLPPSTSASNGTASESVTSFPVSQSPTSPSRCVS